MERESTNLKRSDLVYPELSYRLVGIFYNIHNQLGGGLKEKHYQNAIAEELSKNDIKFTKEFPVTIPFKNKEIGKYFLDFLIEDKIVLEIKIKHFKKEFFDQLLGYLKQTDLKLGIIAIFGKDKLTFKRIINL